VSLKRVKYIGVDDGKVRIEISFAHDDPYLQEIIDEIKEKVSDLPGVKDIEVVNQEGVIFRDAVQVIYVSRHGASKRYAEAIAEALDGEAQSVEQVESFGEMPLSSLPGCTITN